VRFVGFLSLFVGPFWGLFLAVLALLAGASLQHDFFDNVGGMR